MAEHGYSIENPIRLPLDVINRLGSLVVVASGNIIPDGWNIAIKPVDANGDPMGEALGECNVSLSRNEAIAFSRMWLDAQIPKNTRVVKHNAPNMDKTSFVAPFRIFLAQ